MLSKERIKEAEKNVKSYLAEGLLKKTNINKPVMSIFLRNAKESLRVAEEVHQKELSELWVIVCWSRTILREALRFPLNASEGSLL